MGRRLTMNNIKGGFLGWGKPKSSNPTVELDATKYESLALKLNGTDGLKNTLDNILQTATQNPQKNEMLTFFDGLPDSELIECLTNIKTIADRLGNQHVNDDTTKPLRSTSLYSMIFLYRSEPDQLIQTINDLLSKDVDDTIKEVDDNANLWKSAIVSRGGRKTRRRRNKSRRNRKSRR